MSRKSKLIFQIIILILFVSGAAFYFLYFEKKNWFSRPEEPALTSLEELLEFKNYDQGLSPEIYTEYLQQFTAAKEVILNKPEVLNTNAWLTAARMKTYVKDYQGAEKIYAYLIEADSNNYIPEGNLADLYANYFFDYQKATEHYWRAVGKIGLNKQTAIFYWRNLADIYAFQLKDKRDEFEKKAEQALKDDYQESVDFLTMLAKYYKDRGEKEKAIAYLEEALKLAPTNQAIKEELGRLRE